MVVAFLFANALRTHLIMMVLIVHDPEYVRISSHAGLLTLSLLLKLLLIRGLISSGSEGWF